MIKINGTKRKNFDKLKKLGYYVKGDQTAFGQLLLVSYNLNSLELRNLIIHNLESIGSCTPIKITILHLEKISVNFFFLSFSVSILRCASSGSTAKIFSIIFF